MVKTQDKQTKTKVHNEQDMVRALGPGSYYPWSVIGTRNHRQHISAYHIVALASQPPSIHPTIIPVHRSDGEFWSEGHVVRMDLSVSVLFFCAWNLLHSITPASLPQSEKCSLNPGQIQRKFITVFMQNIFRNSDTTFQLYLVTCDKAATVTVSVSQPFFNQTIYIDQNSSCQVTLDYTYMITEKDITSKVIMVTSDMAISVIAFYTAVVSADAMTCLPQEDLGMEYYIITPGDQTSGQVPGTSRQFAVANGFEHDVQVHITVSGSITYNGISYTTGDSFTLLLKNRQVIQFQSSVDLTGTKISSSAPVAVFTGHTCYKGINSACDALLEQLHPKENWGKIFAVFPFFTHTQDVIKIIAGSADTLVTIDSPEDTTQHSLQEAAHVTITADKILLINATKPVMILYLLQESHSTGITFSYDPFITTVPPSLLGRKYYKFVTQSVYDNFFLIVSEASSDSEFYLDGKPLSSYPTTVKKFKGFRGWQVTLGKTDGQYEIYHELTTFTLYIYGIGSTVSYGYSMGHDLLYPDPLLLFPTQEVGCGLRCLPHGAEYTLPSSLLSEATLDVADIHLKDPLCQAELNDTNFLIKIPYDRCGSKILYEDGRAFYANTIYGTIPDTDVHRIEISVRCEMNNNSLELIINPKVNNFICKSYYNVSMKLYHSNSFTDPVTLYPHEVDLHSSLHVEVEVESEDEELQIFIETLTASPSLEDTNLKYTVIQDGCYQDSSLHVHQVTDLRLQRFSFHVFKFDNFHTVYLSCIVIICHNSTSPNRCTRPCLTQRLKRDVLTSKEELDTARLSQGPIVFRSRERITENNYVLTPVLSIVLGITALLAGLGLVIQKEYYQRKMAALQQSGIDHS
ncbi:uncharacterized protein LOC130277453 [Hyla sarda]|uniref:uncharacterized protein LOC130277453 n=1 Tax=Hyla sarda TaxID=327740 RepID=UPI0024C2D02F|nr:uncharacterized protein LOC130277453 [Hyla sarda]